MWLNVIFWFSLYGNNIHKHGWKGMNFIIEISLSVLKVLTEMNLIVDTFNLHSIVNKCMWHWCNNNNGSNYIFLLTIILIYLCGEWTYCKFLINWYKNYHCKIMQIRIVTQQSNFSLFEMKCSLQSYMAMIKKDATLYNLFSNINNYFWKTNCSMSQ